jgi:hypothetical protein
MPDFAISQLLEGFGEFRLKEYSMRKFTTIVVTIFFLSAQASAIAEPPPGYLDFQDRLVIEACILTSEKPHLSKHVPGTVNVTGRTVCKGISAGRNLQVTVTLTRKDGGNTSSITKSSRGVGSVIVNVAMPCIWSRKQTEIEYIVRTVHKMSNGKTGNTENGALLKC